MSADSKPLSARPARLDPAYLDVDELLDDLEHEVVFRNGALFGSPMMREQRIANGERKIAFALSGGGAAGAYSAGSIEALLGRMKARKLAPSLLVGTSAGALNSYGVFCEALGRQNPQLAQDPDIKQPYSTFIASIWSYLDRNGRTSEWVVGRRAWMIDLVTKGLHTPLRRWTFFLFALLMVFVFNPFLFVSLFLFAGFHEYLPVLGDWTDEANAAWHLALLGALSLGGLAAMTYALMRLFGQSLFLDTPLLRMLANTGVDGDLRAPTRWSAEQTRDRARVLSRDLVREWYSRIGTVPELIITATDITVGRECLFTLVRPETYRRLVEQGWMAVQLDSEDDSQTRAYREISGAVFSLGQNLLHCIVASTAVPSAFPAQEIRLYGPGQSRTVCHRFVDGGVLNNSPIHLSIDAGATHIISLELDPLKTQDPLESDDRGRFYNILEAGVTTFTTLLDRAIERDMRRTVTWNRFLTQHPQALAEQRSWIRRGAEDVREVKRVLPLYRIAPQEREIGTVEFDGAFEQGRNIATVRDVLRRGMLDLRGRHVWRATLQPTPFRGPDGLPSKAK
ncbi:MAG: patatin-like phospholipase family protein [Bryobacterales bacterium]|nr:patatin-like phospholipase family protein [Bryobacterales bacterium]